LPVDDTDPKVLRRLETRLLVRDNAGGVYGASYKWRDDNSDADLVNAGVTEEIPIKTAAGTRTQKWFFPGRQDCLTCHSAQSSGVLGVNTRQLNGDFEYPGTVGAPRTDNQLRVWNHLGLFDTTLREDEISSMEKMVAMTNTSAPLIARVRSYLDANCSQCHHHGGVEAFFDASFDTPIEKQNLINGPVANQLGLAGARIVVPGDTNKSILFRRISMVGNLQMPPIARGVVDQKAVDTIAQWIDSLPKVSAGLPKNWGHVDVGDVALPGDASFLKGQFNVVASGADIGGSMDEFHFVYALMNGDGEIVAHVKGLQFTDPWAKAGVMFREDLLPGAQQALTAVTAEGNWELQVRTTNNQATTSSVGPLGKGPCWIKMVRSGNVFSSYKSLDRSAWQFLGSVTNEMPGKLYVGLAVTSHNNAVLNSALFDGVTLQAGQSATRNNLHRF